MHFLLNGPNPKHISEHKEESHNKALQTIAICILLELSRVYSEPVHALCNLSCNGCPQFSVVGVITPNVQRENSRLRDIMEYAQGHTEELALKRAGVSISAPVRHSPLPAAHPTSQFLVNLTPQVCDKQASGCLEAVPDLQDFCPAPRGHRSAIPSSQHWLLSIHWRGSHAD